MDRHQDSYMRREEQLKSQLAAYTQHDAAAAVAGNSHRGSQAGDAGAVHEADSNSAGSTATSQNGHRVHKPATLQDMQHQVTQEEDASLDLLRRTTNHEHCAWLDLCTLVLSNSHATCLMA